MFGGRIVGQIPAATYRNHLLRFLERDDLAALSARLEPVDLPQHHVLIRANEPVEAIVFLERGIASIVSASQIGRRIEVGIVGREGMAGGSLLLGVDRVPHEIFMQVGGTGSRITADAFLDVLLERPGIAKLLLRYVHAFGIQVAQTVLANSICTIEERLARWLLMSHDRVDGDKLSLTHEFLGTMLAVRRSGVTLVIQAFEGRGILKAERKLITILNRPALLKIAGRSYGVPEEEYERILGPFRG